MLINLFGTVDDNGVIIFENLPCVFFTSNHTVHVTELSIKWKQSMGRSFGQLNSTLIDRSPLNPNQQLMFIYHQSSKLTYLNPRNPAVYKVQCPDLSQSVFTLTDFNTEKIEKIYIQLCIAYEGFQQIHK